MLTVTFVVILVGNLWMMYQSTVQHSKSPSILGYSPLIVNTGSMEGNKADDFNVGDLVVIHKTENTLNLKKGTIITFVDPHSESKALVTHRINRVVTHDKDHVYETKGDANNTIDKGVINPSQIIGVYQLHLKGFGSKLMFLQSPKGMFLFIVLPLIILFGSDYIIQAFKPKVSKHENGQTPNSVMSN
ncbi:signal peptidase I [Lactococcus raffinolactis]|uniref:signal peptidase I n=1 Tax=Pseudolactococcus raffinolactis TaxID=1366 RepID=UPI0021686147|nr:signal peptidase I [Lactococcus raffinolactis]